MKSIADSDRKLALADALYVLEWLRQTDAPSNIVELQSRAVRILDNA